MKSAKAIDKTLAIIETFTKVRELSGAVNQFQTLPENSLKQKNLIEHTGDLIAVFKIKKTIKKGK